MPARRNKRGAAQKRYTDRQIADALRAGAGIVNKAAEVLRCKRDTIARRVSNSKTLQHVIRAAKEQAGDVAEDTFMMALEVENLLMKKALEDVRNGAVLVEVPKLPATQFANRTLNRHRGYTQSTELTGPNGEPLIPQNFVVSRPAPTAKTFGDWAGKHRPADEEQPDEEAQVH